MKKEKKEDKHLYLIGFDNTCIGFAYNKKEAKEAAKRRNYDMVKVKKTPELMKTVESDDHYLDNSLVHSYGGQLMFGDEEAAMLESFGQFELENIRAMENLIQHFRKLKLSKKEKAAVEFLVELMEYHIKTSQEDGIIDDEYYYNWTAITDFYIDNVVKLGGSYL